MAAKKRIMLSGTITPIILKGSGTYTMVEHLTTDPKIQGSNAAAMWVGKNHYAECHN
jgi:hypothetical protein